jgi:hypothetical protein
MRKLGFLLTLAGLVLLMVAAATAQAQKGQACERNPNGCPPNGQGGGGSGGGGGGNSVNQGRHTICHATGSSTNPYVVITPAKAGVYNGHYGGHHQGARDIIPPMQYDADWDGDFETYSQNWDSEGQAIFNNGCEVPGGGGGGGNGNGGGGGGGGGEGVLGEQAGGGQAGAGGAGVAGEAVGELPFTGIPVVLLIVAGFSLLGGGLALRRLTR